jgi:hypothetical protein
MTPSSRRFGYSVPNDSCDVPCVLWSGLCRFLRRMLHPGCCRCPGGVLVLDVVQTVDTAVEKRTVRRTYWRPSLCYAHFVLRFRVSLLVPNAHFIAPLMPWSGTNGLYFLYSASRSSTNLGPCCLTGA